MSLQLPARTAANVQWSSAVGSFVVFLDNYTGTLRKVDHAGSVTNAYAGVGGGDIGAPTLVLNGETFSIPDNRQVPFRFPITVDPGGSLVVGQNSHLYQV
jgi:hypothetical protein